MDCSAHRIFSKWKDLQGKVMEFNALFTHKMNTHELGVSDEEVLNTTKNEYRKHHNMKDFRHKGHELF